jgi:acyl-CoA synthetase (AMP-forming)/AMP-acid ligase II
MAGRPAIIFEDGLTTRSISWQELDDQSNRIANALLATGRRRRHIGILFNNCPEFVAALFGIAKADCVSVILNARLTARELSFCVVKADIEAVIAATELRAGIEAAVGELASFASERLFLIDPRNPDEKTYWLENAQAADPGLDIDPDAHAAILFTSGTTGEPKAAVYTHRRLTTTYDAFSREMATSRNDRVLLAAPLYAGLGLNFAAGTLYIGGSILLVYRFDADLILSAIERHRPTMVPMAPTMYYILAEALNNHPADTSSMRVCLSLGSSLTPPVRARIQKLFPHGEIYELYGSTETGITVMLHPEDGGKHIVNGGRVVYSVGQAAMGVSIRLLDDDGKDVAPGEVGEIYKRNLLGACEYYGNPALTATIYRGEWLTANDLGQFDADGHLYVLGRKKDMIVTGGLNVYAAEVEEILSRFPDIGMFAVVGFPDPKWGELVTAVIQGDPRHFDEAALSRHCHRVLADYKCPKRFLFIEALPLTASGKIEKYKLPALFGEATGLLMREAS